MRFGSEEFRGGASQAGHFALFLKDATFDRDTSVCRIDGSSSPKVNNLGFQRGVAAHEENVTGRNVPVHNAARVHVADGLEQRGEYPFCLML